MKIPEINKHNTQNSSSNIDALPVAIRSSTILTHANLVLLANAGELPFIDPAFDDDKLKNIIQYYSIDPEEMEKELHYYANELLDAGKLHEAWQVLLALN
jgi:hypothetical protein